MKIPDTNKNSILLELNKQYLAKYSEIPLTVGVISELNDIAAMIAHQYIYNGEIEFSESLECFFVKNVPIDIFPFLPLCCNEISEYGSYDIFCAGKLVGSVQYSGAPEPDISSGVAELGVKTCIIPIEYDISIGFEIKTDKT